jgi:hypothetical protein
MSTVDKYLEELDKKIKVIADKHRVRVKPEDIRKLTNPPPIRGHPPNAIAHIKALEVNESHKA